MQVHSSAKNLRLVTFDADGTLYADGCHMEHDNEMVGPHLATYQIALLNPASESAI